MLQHARRQPPEMPLPPAEIVPELLMPPEKAEIVTVAVFLLVRAGTLASPPAQMPLPAAEIVPELLMPPEKVKTVTDTVWAVQQASALPPARMPLPPAEKSCRNCRCRR